MEVHEEMDPPWISRYLASSETCKRHINRVAQLTLGCYNLLQMYNIVMFQRFQDLHLANGRNRESIFLCFRINSLEGYNFSSNFVGTNKHTPASHLLPNEWRQRQLKISNVNQTLEEQAKPRLRL